MLEKTTRINMLYDFYGKLLTDKQREYMELYYREDHSLGEIAEFANVSRQAIYDNIKRTELLIENYEVKLELHAKFTKRKQLLDRLHEKIKVTGNIQMLEMIEALDKLN